MRFAGFCAEYPRQPKTPENPAKRVHPISVLDAEKLSQERGQKGVLVPPTGGFGPSLEHPILHREIAFAEID
jgi:hypothetical protein